MKYSALSSVYDLGPYINKIILDLEGTVINCEIDEDTFQVYTVRKDKLTGEVFQVGTFLGIGESYPSEGYRKVVSSYVSDKEGNAVQGGAYVTLELEVDPRISLGATIAFNGMFNVRVNCENTITQIKPITCGKTNLQNMVFSELDTFKTMLADEFITGVSECNGITLTYAAFEPKPSGDKRPLLIWLHGAGEGGTDPIIAVSGNKVVNLITEDIQKFFHGAYVLGPQTPTVWMDDGVNKFVTKGKTIYTEALRQLIDEFIANHEDIDTDRIYLGGCSNGGFMTLKMIITYPQMFAAAYPICEALEDIYVSDEDINKIKNIPIWFIHAENDPIVKIDIFPDPTYKRLIQARAENIHYSRLKNVVDQTGKFFNENGTPYEYNGHFSWIPALNNEITLDINNEPVSLFEWISLQVRE